MSRKKNIFSCILWLVYSIGVAGLLYLMLSFYIADQIVRVFMTAGVTVVVGTLVFVIHKLAGKIHIQNYGRVFFPILNTILFVILLFIGFFLRVQQMDTVDLDSQIYFDLAKVNTSNHVAHYVHGSVYIYVMLLNRLFVFLGNKVQTGIFLQIVLQLFCSGFLYFALRSLTGYFCSILAFAGMMCSPYLIQNSLMYSPAFLTFFGYTLFFMWTFRQRKKKIRLVEVFLLGMAAGLITYLDVIGVTLVLVILYAALIAENSVEKNAEKGLALICSLLGGAFGFFCCIFADASLSGKSLGRILEVWFKLYQPDEIRWQLQQTIPQPEAMILVILLCVGIFSFWLVKQTKQFSLFTVLLFMVILLDGLQITTREMPGEIVGFYFLLVLAAIGLTDCVRRKEVELVFTQTVSPNKEMSQIVEQAEQETSVQVQEQVQKSVSRRVSVPIQMKNNKEAAEQTQQTDQTANGIKLLDNPLPLPKKHVKKILNYDRTDFGDGEDYDFKVPDDDDFDH